MLKKGTKVNIISKSIGISSVYYETGYIISVRDGKDKFNYNQPYYSVSTNKNHQSGDHFLECDLVDVNKQPDFFKDEDFLKGI